MDADIRRLRELVAGNIKKYRKISGLTQEKLAEKANLSSNMVNDIEGCRTWISDKTIQKLSKALDIKVYQLFLPEYNTKGGVVRVSKEMLEHIKEKIDDILDYPVDNV